MSHWADGLDITEPTADDLSAAYEAMTFAQVVALQVEILNLARQVFEQDDWQGTSITAEETDDAAVAAIDELILRAKAGDL